MSIAATADVSAEEQWLTDMAQRNNYFAPTLMPDGKWTALMPLAFTMAIITGNLFDDFGYEDRWCYSSYEKASVALAWWIALDFEGEPQGWHRHPNSGRRRPDGDVTQEYINP